ncbi:MAG: radical SAM family heme chaperone HemW [Pseudobdellovibrio sp.]
MSERFGVYIHIPYCLQRCTYCDFATYVHTEIKPPEYYVSLVKKEISNKRNLFPHRMLDTIYFGGGTPSLIPAHLIVELISELAKFGYTTGPQTEITIEINPATVDEKKLETYLAAGVNRFSVGAQSFSDRLLKMVHREHNAQQTIQTLELLRKYNLNFSFDVLFALPTQSLDELKYDVQVAVELGSKHISPYCLTVPEAHPLSKNRPLDEEQIEMFNIIHTELTKKDFKRYEISNYALSGFESKHNLLYWTDQPYWGLGLSAHSYSKKSEWGSRFWNVNSFELYDKQMNSENVLSGLTDYIDDQIEHLEKHQALTDFCYTSLRLEEGLSVEKLVSKFGTPTLDLVTKIAKPMLERKLLSFDNNHYALSNAGVVISNQIFEKFAFLKEDLTR